MSAVEEKIARRVWLEIKAEIKDEIDRGHYKHGDSIPSVAGLAKRYGVSIHTIRLAIDELAQEGVLVVHQGKKTIVAPPKLDYDPMLGFTDQVQRLGQQVYTRVLDTGWHRAHRDTTRYLELKKAVKVWILVRLHHLDGLPAMIEFAEIKASVAERLMDSMGKLESLFRTLRRDLGFKDIEVELLGVDVTSDRYFSELLGIQRRTTFYSLERRVLESGEPIVVSYLILRNDRFRIRFGENMRRMKYPQVGEV